MMSRVILFLLWFIATFAAFRSFFSSFLCLLISVINATLRLQLSYKFFGWSELLFCNFSLVRFFSSLHPLQLKILPFASSLFLFFLSVHALAWRLINVVTTTQCRAVAWAVMMGRMIVPISRRFLFYNTPNSTTTGFMVSSFPRCILQIIYIKFVAWALVVVRILPRVPG